MYRSIKIIIPILVASLAAIWVYAGTIVGTASLTVGTPSPTPTSGVPTPPALTNAQVITPNSNPGGHCHIAGDGTTDDTACIKTLMGVGDLDFKAGTYVLNATGSSFIPPSGRNVLCENSSLPPTSANATVIIKVPTADTANGGQWILFQDWHNGTWYGCEIQAFHYPNTIFTDAGQNESLVGLFSSGGGFNFRANDVHGMPGFTGVIDISISYTSWQAGAWVSNIDVSYNNFSDCNVRALEPDYGKNITFTHNNLTNCGAESEIQDSRETGETILWDSNTITQTNACHGNCSSSIYNTSVGGGSVCHWPGPSGNGGAFPCRVGIDPPADYSGVTFSNNTIIGTNGVQTYMLVTDTCSGGTNPAAVAVYRSNTCTSGNSCTEHCPPGNPNANFWGPGSNQ